VGGRRARRVKRKRAVAVGDTVNCPPEGTERLGAADEAGGRERVREHATVRVEYLGGKAHGLGGDVHVQRRHRGSSPAEQESLTCARSCDTDSASLPAVPDAAPDLEALRLAGAEIPLAVKLDSEKLSSDQQTLSHRNAAEARRRPVWSSAAASSINPRWKQAWPKTKYLHWVSAQVFLEKPVRTRCLSSDMSKQEAGGNGGSDGAGSRVGESRSVQKTTARLPEPEEQGEEEVA
jgi:hypothetical protein